MDYRRSWSSILQLTNNLKQQQHYCRNFRYISMFNNPSSNYKFPSNNFLSRHLQIMESKNEFQWADDNTSSTTSISSKFILPESHRPNLDDISLTESSSIPVVDMDSSIDDHIVAQQIANACNEYGFFQLINHKVEEELCKNVLDVITQFFLLPHEQKAHLVSKEHMEDGKIFKYYVKDEVAQTKIPMWSEALFHTWNPVDNEFLNRLPENPPAYRETIAEYTRKIGVLMTNLTRLMSLGLGLEEDRLKNILGDKLSYSAQANYYPACPNPEQTLGLRSHTDFKILTVILQQQGVAGLHVLVDDKWVAVHPQPGALVVNVADQLQVLSNDKYKSAIHRAVINKDNSRASFALFYGPNDDTYIEPIEDLIDEDHPAIYRKYQFSEFVKEFRNQEGNRRTVKEKFKI